MTAPVKKRPAKLTDASAGTATAAAAASPDYVSVTTGKPATKYPINFVGEDHKVEVPKAWLGLALAVAGKNAEEDPDLMLKRLVAWVTACFGTETAPHIMDRLDSPTDRADLGHVMELMSDLSELDEDGSKSSNPSG